MEYVHQQQPIVGRSWISRDRSREPQDDESGQKPFGGHAVYDVMRRSGVAPMGTAACTPEAALVGLRLPKSIPTYPASTYDRLLLMYTFHTPLQRRDRRNELCLCEHAGALRP